MPAEDLAVPGAFPNLVPRVFSSFKMAVGKTPCQGYQSDLWSISAALARGFSDRHFERGEGPGDEVGSISCTTKGI